MKRHHLVHCESTGFRRLHAGKYCGCHVFGVSRFFFFFAARAATTLLPAESDLRHFLSALSWAEVGTDEEAPTIYSLQGAFIHFDRANYFRHLFAASRTRNKRKPQQTTPQLTSAKLKPSINHQLLSPCWVMIHARLHRHFFLARETQYRCTVAFCNNHWQCHL